MKQDGGMRVVDQHILFFKKEVKDMYQRIKMWFSLAILALVFFSCNKEEKRDNSKNQTDYTEISVTIPSQSKIAMESLGSTIKQMWSDGDKISVIYRDKDSKIYNDCFTLASGSGTTTATFKNKGGKIPDDAKITILYPYREKISDNYWSLPLNPQNGTINSLGSIFPLIATNQDVKKVCNLTPIANILYLPKGLKLFTNDTKENLSVKFSVNGKQLYISTNYNLDKSILEGNKGEIKINNVTLSNGVLNSDIYVVIFTNKEVTDVTELEINIEREGKEYKWDLSLPWEKTTSGSLYKPTIDASGVSFVLPPQTIFSREIYVSKTGNDSNLGTKESPFLTIQKAFDVVEKGGRINIDGGVYNERAMLYKSGTKENPIVIRSYNSTNRAVIDGTGITNSQGTYFALITLIGEGTAYANYTGANHIIVDGLEIINSPMNGISGICGSSNVTIQNCTIKNCSGSAIAFGIMGKASENINVYKNYIENCSQTVREAISLRKVNNFDIWNNHVKSVVKESIDAKSGSRNGTIRENIVENCGAGGIYIDAGYAVENQAGLLTYGEPVPETENILIYCNKVITATPGTGIAVASEQGNKAHDIHIFNNIVYFGGAHAQQQTCGIKVADNSDVKTGELKNIYIYNNTIYNHAQQGIYVNFPNVKNIVIRNNISAYNDAGNMSLKSNVDEKEVIIENNLYYGYTTSHPGKNYFTVTDLNTLFTNISNFDFTLKKGATAIDNGSSLSAPEKDFAGNPRPKGKGIDIGAYEYQE